MQAYKREFIEFLENAGVLKFGDFTAKSGRKIPYFIKKTVTKTYDKKNKKPFFTVRHIRVFRLPFL